MDQAAQGVVKLYVSHLYREAAGIVLVSTVVPGSPADALGVKVGSMVLGLLAEMQGRGLEPDVITYSAAISVCGKGHQP